MNELAQCRMFSFDDDGNIIDIIEQGVSRRDDGEFVEPIDHTMCRLLSYMRPRSGKKRHRPEVIGVSFCIDGRMIEEFQVGHPTEN